MVSLVGAGRYKSPAERVPKDLGARTRAKILGAVRELLFERGFAGTTYYAIRDASGCSIGSMQHQFGTKAQLLAAAGTQAAEFRLRVYRDAIRRGDTPRQSIENLIDANFEILGTTEMAAWLEIDLARRGDAELDLAVAPVARRLERYIRRWCSVLLRAAGVPIEEVHRTAHMLDAALTRGLAIEYIRGSNREAIEQSISLWRGHLLMLLFGQEPRADLSMPAQSTDLYGTGDTALMPAGGGSIDPHYLSSAAIPRALQ